MKGKGAGTSQAIFLQQRLGQGGSLRGVPGGAFGVVFGGVLGGVLGVIRGGVRGHALLGLHHEMPGAIQIHETAPAAAGVDEGHRVLEMVGLGLGRLAGRSRPGHTQQIAQLIGEALEIRPFAAA